MILNNINLINLLQLEDPIAPYSYDLNACIPNLSLYLALSRSRSHTFYANFHHVMVLQQISQQCGLPRLLGDRLINDH